VAAGAHASGIEAQSALVGAHATHIVGRALGEGRILLADLLEHATQREFVFRHAWRVGDLVMWTTACVLHRGRRFDLSQRRELRAPPPRIVPANPHRKRQ